MQLQCLLHCCSAILARFILLFSAVSRTHSSIHLFGSHVAVLKFGQTAIVYAKDRDRDKQTNRQKEWEIDRPQFNVLFKNIEEKKRFHFHSCCCCMVRYSAALKMIAMGQLGVAFIHFFLECHHSLALYTTHINILVDYYLRACMSECLFIFLNGGRTSAYSMFHICLEQQTRTQKKTESKQLTGKKRLSNHFEFQRTKIHAIINFAYKNCQPSTFALLIVLFHVQTTFRKEKNRLVASKIAGGNFMCVFESFKQRFKYSLFKLKRESLYTNHKHRRIRS